MRSKRRLAVLLLVFLVVSGSALVVSVGGRAGAEGATLPALRAKARAQGLVPVIVGLDVGRGVRAEAEGEPGSQAVRERQRAIARAQEALLQDLPLPPEARGHVVRFRTIPYVALWADEATLEALGRHPRVTFLREQLVLRPVGFPRAGTASKEPELRESVPRIGGSAQGDFQGYTGAGWAVAVLDTGVDGSHPFLQGKVIAEAEACFSLRSPLELLESVCPNGQEQMIGPGAGGPCAAAGCEHGTHVAGIVAGDGRNFPPGTAPPAGVARDARIVAVQVFSALGDVQACNSVGLPAPCAIAPDPNVLQGLEYVLQLVRAGMKIAAVNLSLGGDGPFNSEALCDAQLPDWRSLFEQLRSVGVAVVVAAGNEGFSDGVDAPACLSSAIAVGSTTKDDQVSFFSNSGEPLDLWAPGGDGGGGRGDILSSVPGGGFAPQAGTSMAAPHVAGAIAVYKQKYPDASPDDVLRAFQGTGVPVTDPLNGLTRPRLQLDAALQQAPQPQPEPQPQPQPLPEDLVLRTLREVARPGAICLKALRLRNLRGGPTGDVTVVGVRPVGVGWGPGVRVVRGPGQLLRDGGLTVLLTLDRTCTGTDLALEVELSNGLVGEAGIGVRDRGVNRIELTLTAVASGAMQLRVRVLGAKGKLKVRLFAPDGRRVMEAEATGSRLTAPLGLRDPRGQPLANGVYLAAVTVERLDGTVTREIRKVAVLR